MGHLLHLAAGFCLFCICLSQLTDPCPFWPGALNADGKCFKLFLQKLNFSQAQEFCQQQGHSGSLVEILTQQYWRMVMSLVANYTKHLVWVGGHNDSQTRRFKWVKSGITLDPNSTFWAPGEPNNLPENSQCCAILFGRFIDLDCSYRLENSALICQRNVRPATVPCYFWEGSTYVNQKCFKLFNSRATTWSEALATCRSQGPRGTLAEVLTEQQRSVAADMVQNYTNVSAAQVWIGYSDIAHNNSFVWTSTNSSQPAPASSWWVEQNPSHTIKGYDEDCVTIRSNRTLGRLNDVACSYSYNFLCQLTVPDPCYGLMPDGAEYFQGRCYLSVDGGMSSSEAQNYCKTMTANPVEVKPKLKETRSVVVDVVNPSTSAAVGKSGLSRLDNYPCYPGIQGPVKSWLCGSANESRVFICERDHGDPCETYLPGGLYIKGQCFKYMSAPMSWLNAQDYCREMDAFLAEPETQDLSNALNLYLMTLNASTAWIGARRMDTRDLFQWVTSGHSLTYSLLREARSNEASENHMAVQDASYWSQAGSDEARPFICQTAVTFGKADSWSVATSIPKLQDVSDLEAYLEVTSHILSYSVSLQVILFGGQDGFIEKTDAVLEPGDSFSFKIDPRLLMNKTGVFTGYVLVQSTSPVTVVLYTFSSSKKLDSSTLLLPGDVVQRAATAASYFLISSCGQGCQENVVAAMTLEGPAEVRVLFPKSDNVSRGLNIGKVMISQVESARATTVSKMGSVYLHLDMNFDGAYLSCPGNASVLIGGSPFIPPPSGGRRAQPTSEEPGDSVIDQLLPVDLIDNEYFTFPSMTEDSQDFVKIVAVKSDTQVELFETQGYTRKIMLPHVGDVAEVPLPSDQFFYLRGNTGFYAFKLSKRRKGSSACLTSLYSSNLWRQQYSFQMTSRLANYDVYIAVIVSQIYSHNLTVRVPDLTPLCKDIPGTTMSGCVYRLPSDQPTYYHLHLNHLPPDQATNHLPPDQPTNHSQDRLGAYLVALSASSMMCHVMGVRTNPKPTFIFDHQEFIKSLQENPACETPTTDGTFPSTTSSVTSEANLTVDNIPAVTTRPSPKTDLIYPAPSSDLSAGATPWNFSEVIPDHEHLVMDTRTTSAYRRTKISAPDDRPSAITIGSLGISCLVFTFVVIVFVDAIKLLLFLIQKK